MLVNQRLLVPKFLVPVQVFTGQCECGRDGGYGISDAISAWSDCNRAVGHIYRFEDIPNRHCASNDRLTVMVEPQSFHAFLSRNFDAT